MIMIIMRRTLISASRPRRGRSLPSPFGRGLSAATHWSCEEHNHVVHAAAKRRADQNPKRLPGRNPNFGGEHRTDKWPRPGDPAK